MVTSHDLAISPLPQRKRFVMSSWPIHTVVLFKYTLTITLEMTPGVGACGYQHSCEWKPLLRPCIEQSTLWNQQAVEWFRRFEKLDIQQCLKKRNQKKIDEREKFFESQWWSWSLGEGETFLNKTTVFQSLSRCSKEREKYQELVYYIFARR